MPDPDVQPVPDSSDQRLKDVMGSLGQPAPTASPIANPSNDTFGTILRYGLPLVAGALAGSNPALARGVQAASGIMNQQQDFAERQQRLNMEKKQSDLQFQQMSGVQHYFSSPTSPELSDKVPSTSGPRLKDVMGAGQIGNGLDDGTMSATGTQAPPSSGVDSVIAKQIQGIHDQGRAAVQMGDYKKAMDLALQERGMRASVTPQDVEGVSLGPGTELDAHTLYGNLKRTVPNPEYSPRPETIVGSPGAKGPNGEDLSGQDVIAAMDKTSGNVKILGKRSPKEMNVQPFTVINDARSTPQQKTDAWRAIQLEHPEFGSFQLAYGADGKPLTDGNGNIKAFDQKTGGLRVIPASVGVSGIGAGNKPPASPKDSRQAFVSKLLENPNITAKDRARRVAEYDATNGSGGSTSYQFYANDGKGTRLGSNDGQTWTPLSK